MGRLSERKQGKKKKKSRGGGKGFQEVWVTSNINIKDLVDTGVRNIVCDPPIARTNHTCRGLLYGRCWV